MIERSLSSGSAASSCRSLTADKRGVSRVAVTRDGATVFAAGSDIRVLDVSSGQVVRKLQGHSAPVTSMTLSSDSVSCARYVCAVCRCRHCRRGSAYSCGYLHHETVPLLIDATYRFISCPSLQQCVVTCSDERNIHLWDLKDASTSAAMSSLSSSSDGTDNGSIAPTVVLLHTGRPMPNSLSVLRVKKGQYHIACVSEDGSAHVWRYKRSKDSAGGSSGAARKPIPAGCIIRPVLEAAGASAAVAAGGKGKKQASTNLNAELPSILAIQLVKPAGDDDAPVASLVVGPLAAPSFYRAPYTAEGEPTHLVDNVALTVKRAAASGETAAAAAAKASAQAKKAAADSDEDDDADMDAEEKDNDVAAADAALASSGRAKDANAEGEAVVQARGAVGAKGMKDESGANAASGVGKKRSRSDAAGKDANDDGEKVADELGLVAAGDDDEGTLGQRMMAVISALRNPAATDLTSAIAAPSSSAATAAGSSASASGGKVQSVAEALSTTGSLAVVLSQALQAHDDAQLEMVLAVADKGVIATTVSRLASPMVLPFLQRVVARFQAKPTRGAQLLAWVRAVLTSHTGFLLSQPSLVASLEGLYTIIDTRVSVYKKLLKLSGRLDLLLAQVGTGPSSAAAVSSRTVRKAKLRVAEADLQQQKAMRNEFEAADEEEEEDDEDDDEDADDMDEDDEEEDGDDDDDEDSDDAADEAALNAAAEELDDEEDEDDEEEDEE